MLSLFVWIGVLLTALPLAAWAVAYAARRAGSPRGRFRFGLVIQLLIGAVNGLFVAAAALVPRDDDLTALLVELGLILVNMWAAFVLMRWVFGLSTRRTFVPFGTFILLNLAFAVFVAGVIRPFVCQTNRLPSVSMSPTLERGARVSVNKLITPRRWDLVVYYNEARGELYCKRLVGLPGERIRFERGSLFVNDQPLEAPAVLAGRLRTTVPNVPPGMILYEEGETIQLGPTEYFLIGDNLERSNDSRLEGPTDVEHLVGVIDLVYWPPRNAAILR